MCCVPSIYIFHIFLYLLTSISIECITLLISMFDCPLAAVMLQLPQSGTNKGLSYLILSYLTL